MKLKVNGKTIIFEDDVNSFEIFQSSDNDIWFISENPNIQCVLDFSSRNIEEWKTFEVFSYLIKEIFGNYILEDYNTFTMLPDDFIDLNNKIITWHSDSGTNNVLKLAYDSKRIAISRKKDPKASQNSNNGVRIRTSGSNYGIYYQFFIRFYKELLNLSYDISPEQLSNNKQKLFTKKNR